MSRFVVWALCALLAALCAAVLASACSGDDPPPPEEAVEQEVVEQEAVEQEQEAVAQEAVERLQVVVSTQVIADWTRQVGGDAVSVTALVPAGADVHTIELSTGDIRAVSEAELVVINGAGLEAGYEDAVVDNASNLLVLADALEAGGLELQPFSDLTADGHEEEEGEDHDDGHEEEEGEDHGEEHEEHEQEEGEHHDDEHEEEEGEHDGEEHEEHEQEEGEHHDDGHEEEEGEHDGEEHEDEEGEHDGEEHEEHEEHEEEEGGHDGHGHGAEDPHFWFDADFAIAAVEAIAEALSELAPDAADGFNERAEAYIAEIRETDAELRAIFAELPEERRLLVTFHDAFGYFARRYGLTVAGFVVEGPEQGVSAGTIADLVELMEHEGISRIFREPQFESAAIEAVANESGAEIGIIYSQPHIEQNAYLSILRANAEAIAGD